MAAGGDTVSVVIPLYNKAPYIERALKSVLAQTAPPAEIIVVDDGSTDGSGELVKALGAPGLRLVRQENQGEGSARNRGIKEAQGSLIAFLDADDAWEPRFLEVILDLRRRFPQAGAYATAYDSVTPGGRRRSREFRVLPEGVSAGLITDYFKAAKYWPVYPSAVAVPKAVLEEIGGFHPGQALTQDLDAWFRIALKHPIAWSRESLAVYFENAVNRVITTVRHRGEPPLSRTIRGAIAAGLVPPESIQDLREYAARSQMRAARECLLQGKRELARELLGYARGTKRFAREWKWQWSLLAALPINLFPFYEKIKQMEIAVRGKLKQN